MADLTAEFLKKKLAPGKWKSDGGTRGAGTLWARKLASNQVLFYFRYVDPQAKQIAIPLGQWDSEGKRGLTLLAARDKAGELAKRYRGGERDLKEAIEAENREATRAREAQAQQAKAKAGRIRATLGALLVAYVGQLERQGRASKRDVERAIERNVQVAWPVLWDTPADEITTDDLLAVVAKPADAGKLREAAKLRAYLQAAYSAGIAARQSAQSLPALRELKISTNPARDLATIQGASKGRDRALTVAELRAYWKRIKALAGPAGALLRFHLLTGAQRIEQLGRIQKSDFDPDAMSVRLQDTKGRRKVARAHFVPLIPEAKAALDAMQGGTLGPNLFTVTAGESGAVYSTLQSRLRDVVAEMLEADEASAPFTAGDLRRTVETRLAALGVSAETRAQLQSHGLGGVQSRHYDRHDYDQEKRDALTQLFELITRKSATVVPLKRAKGAARKK